MSARSVTPVLYIGQHDVPDAHPRIDYGFSSVPTPRTLPSVCGSVATRIGMIVPNIPPVKAKTMSIIVIGYLKAPYRGNQNTTPAGRMLAVLQVLHAAAMLYATGQDVARKPAATK